MPTNRRSDVAGNPAPPPMDLAHEAPFMLGGVSVAPAALSVAAGDWSRRLEPRVMQVLIILAQASPAVVDLYRLRGGKLVEHWDVLQAVLDKSANPHPMF